MDLKTAAQITQGVLHGENRSFSNISINTRTIKAGEVYIALKGEQFDGHSFIIDAQVKGAVGVISEREPEHDFPTIVVKDTKAALMQLAAYKRQQFKGKVLTVTGSFGKTTVRALCEEIFHQAGPTLASQGSFNNDIGMPLTMWQLHEGIEYYIQELGANHMGELAHLTSILKPDVAAITAIGAVHIEGFGSIENIAQAKSEIYSGLNNKGIAIVNADDNFSAYLTEQAGSNKILTFGIEQEADVMAKTITVLADARVSFRLVTPTGEAAITLSLLGRHNVFNALVAASMAVAAGVPIDLIKKGLERAKPVGKRLNIIEMSDHLRLINDSYNASPQTVTAAVEVMQLFDSRHVAVLGDMSELGPEEQQIHTQVGLELKQAGVDALYGFGPLMQYAAKAFGEGAMHFNDKESLLLALQQEMQPNTTILVKGSNSQRVWEVIDALVQLKV